MGAGLLVDRVRFALNGRLLAESGLRQSMAGHARMRAQAFDYAVVGPLYAEVLARFAAMGART